MSHSAMRLLLLFAGSHVAFGLPTKCSNLKKEFNVCTKNAHKVYIDTFKKGSDGRKDWQARISCNYMTEAIENCGNQLIGSCNTKEQVTNMKDTQIKGILEKLETTIQMWDSYKCPVVREHLHRTNPTTLEPEHEKMSEYPEPEPEEYSEVADTELEHKAEEELTPSKSIPSRNLKTMITAGLSFVVLMTVFITVQKLR